MIFKYCYKIYFFLNIIMYRKYIAHIFSSKLGHITGPTFKNNWAKRATGNWTGAPVY